MLAMSNDEDRIAAVLHDLIEDTDWTAEQLRAEGFDAAVVTAIETLTRRPGESYEEFILRVSRNPISRRVKLADLADNLDLSRLPVTSQEDFARVAKYERAKATLLEADLTSDNRDSTSS